MRTALLVFLLCLLCTFQECLADDFLNAGQNITGKTSSLVSAGQRFVLGFFSPPGSPTESYLGIWYNQERYPGNQKVVWVANRDKPVLGSNIGVFQIADDGNLVVTDTSSGGRYWSSELEVSASPNRTMKLMDSGNLVLLQYDQTGKSVYFQSFRDPTDTFLPSMNMDTDLKLTSWSSDNDPRSGSYTFMVAPTGDSTYVILKNLQRYWEKGKNSSSGSMFGTIANLLTNFSMSRDTDASEKNGSPYKNKKPAVRTMNYNDTRLVMNSTGKLQFLTWDNFQSDWVVRWTAPDGPCDLYNACGRFTSSSCDANNNVTCKCLPGFRSVGERGCARKSAPASCGGDTTKFLTLVKVKPGIPDDRKPAKSESECKQMCLHKCNECQAYSYAVPINNDGSVSSCWIWTQDLDTLREEYLDGDEDDDGRNLCVRVDVSDIAPTPRTCEPCGTNMVPYPLSTGPNCGDPMYFNFSCNPSTGQLSFITATSSDTHKVIGVDVESRKFVIQVDDSNTYCEDERSDETLQIRFPFKVTNYCRDKNEVEVTWQPPLEPICTKSVDCEDWKNSSCKAARDGKRCLCNKNYRWDGVSLECTEANEGNSKSQTSLILILGITLTSMVIFASAIIFAFVYRRKITRKKDKESNKRNRERLYDSPRHVKDLIEVGGLEEQDNEGIEVPYFDFENILLATDNFSDANKLGGGGYGPVYKGKLQSGEVVAVKRLSSVSSQGLQEFKNEVILIAKLQHRNLVRLRGYCIRGDEKILLYEYMHNKSLDSFIFDPTQSVLLDWQMRFDIILGVARGLLYLHQDSRLRVIHRDLKTSNILLDEEMQPKISDFGLAKIVGGKETEANTERVAGTHGYMSPEYVMNGLFSTKSDVFSFGVVLLEIISGKKNKGFYQSDQFSSLLGYVWRLWTENKLLELMDMALGESCKANQFIRCAHIGLLCVQDEPSDRPTMSNVVTLLDSETATIPTPKQPTLYGSRGLSTTTSSSKPEISLQFESSIEEGR